MVTMAYSLSTSANQILPQMDLRSASDTDLDYRLFLGNFYFRANDAVFDAPWEWIPLLDLTCKITDALVSVKRHINAIVEFTESSEAIRIIPCSVDTVEVSATYCQSVAVVSIADLESAAEVFSKRLLSELTQRWPELARNSNFIRRRNSMRWLIGD